MKKRYININIKQRRVSKAFKIPIICKGCQESIKRFPVFGVPEDGFYHKRCYKKEKGYSIKEMIKLRKEPKEAEKVG